MSTNSSSLVPHGNPSGPVVNGLDGTRIASFFAYDPGFPLRVRVAAGEVNGDGFADMVTAPGPGGGPDVRVFDGRDGQVLDSFFAYSADAVNGIALAPRDTHGDGPADELLTIAAIATGPQLKGFGGLADQPAETFSLPLAGGIVGAQGVMIG